MCNHQARKLRYIINHALANPPTTFKKSYNKYKYLVFDGTFLIRRKSILALKDFPSKTLLRGKYGLSESNQKDLSFFFYPLKLNGLEPISFTVDGNQHVIRFLTQMWPNVIIQRCLVHIQRQGLMWCRRNPKRADAKKLRLLFLQVTKINTHEEKNEFLNKLNIWENKYGYKLQNQPEKGWVFSDLKRARSMLLKALPNMFHFLDNHSIPKNTNSVESYFSRLKDFYARHRGLAPHKRTAFFDWYFLLKKL